MSLLSSSIAARSQRPDLLKVLLFLLLIAPISARAQSGGKFDSVGTGGAHTIQGHVYLPTKPQAGMTIIVKLDSTNAPSLSVVADQNGTFTFGSLEPGSYDLTVDAGNDFEIFSEKITIDRIRDSGPRTFRVPVYLRLKTRTSIVAADKTVDALLASVPKPALKRYHKAKELAQAGDNRAAIEELKGAISLHAEFAYAYNELGVQYMKLGQLDQAIEALRQAVKLAPAAFSPRLNYGIALLNKKEFSRAEAELRLALKKNASAPTAHLYLGIALISLRNHDEAEKELQLAVSQGGDEMSLAHYYLGGIYWGRREYKRAADELETYLRLAPQAPDAERVRKTIQELRSK
jgi:Flp pilus assembly protein TadD